MTARLPVHGGLIQARFRTYLFELDKSGLLGLGEMAQMTQRETVLPFLEYATTPRRHLCSFCHRCFGSALPRPCWRKEKLSGVSIGGLGSVQ